ncbi:hypothetical protein NDU88_002655 [Pleurodeles waltl]|uniref:Uncharacterized protein n=1 Tax=Pleurodeles waltl TaxID=8319 RepID=A0AAV7NEB4_PLEWA|nr:hypothetical protein NDU88_002655 [Pleurodeles waltl]
MGVHQDYVMPEQHQGRGTWRPHEFRSRELTCFRLTSGVDVTTRRSNAVARSWMHLFSGLSPLREAGLKAEMDCWIETQRHGVLNVALWAEAAHGVCRRRCCLILCCPRGRRISVFLNVCQQEKEPSVHCKSYLATTVGDRVFMTPVKLRARATFRGPRLHLYSSSTAQVKVRRPLRSRSLEFLQGLERGALAIRKAKGGGQLTSKKGISQQPCSLKLEQERGTVIKQALLAI